MTHSVTYSPIASFCVPVSPDKPQHTALLHLLEILTTEVHTLLPVYTTISVGTVVTQMSQLYTT